MSQGVSLSARESTPTASTSVKSGRSGRKAGQRVVAEEGDRHDPRSAEARPEGLGEPPRLEAGEQDRVGTERGDQLERRRGTAPRRARRGAGRRSRGSRSDRSARARPHEPRLHRLGAVPRAPRARRTRCRGGFAARPRAAVSRLRSAAANDLDRRPGREAPASRRSTAAGSPCESPQRAVTRTTGFTLRGARRRAARSRRDPPRTAAIERSWVAACSSTRRATAVEGAHGLGDAVLDLDEVRADHGEHDAVRPAFRPALQAAAFRRREALGEVAVLVQPLEMLVEQDRRRLGVLEQRRRRTPRAPRSSAGPPTAAGGRTSARRGHFEHRAERVP